MQKNIFAISFLSLLGFVSFAYGAYAGVVSYTTDGTIALSGGINLTVKSGSTADTLQVGTTTFTVTVTGTDRFTVESSERRSFTTSVSGYGTECLTSLSRLAISPGTGTVSVTVTPSTSVDSCGSGGGGGGGGGAIGTVTPVPTVARIISATNGGQVTQINNDGTSARVAVPAGALSIDTSFMVSTLSSGYTAPTANTNLIIVGDKVYEITAVSGGSSVTSFAKNITLTFKYLDSQIPTGTPEASLKIHWFDATTSAWVTLESTVDVSANAITAVTNHITKFAILGAKGVGVTSTQPSEKAAATLIRVEGDSRVYVIVNNFKRHIPNPSVFNSYGYKWSDIKTVPAGELAKFQVTTLMRAQGDPKVYAIENGARKWITSLAEFNSKGYKWEAIVEVNAVEIEAYPEEAVQTPASASQSQFAQAGKITIELQSGMRGDQVRLLQEFLAKDADIYPEGKVTGYFGPATKAAIKRFQAKYGINQVGRVGPATIAKLSELMR